MKRISIVVILGLLAAAAVWSQGGRSVPASLSEESASCIECHESDMPGLTKEWRHSRHYAADVGCYECHAAAEGDADAIEHNGYSIAVIVSPLDCSKCHKQEFDEFQKSHHADAGKILGSLDNVLGEVVEGPMAAVNGCKQCHGSIVKVNEDGSLDAATWPNTGMGRINPDGSKGSCAACHSRHSFDAALARQPENCGKCHLGPDHPQKEIYEESKHGIAYYANKDRMNLHSASWVVGIDYSAAPTCATCHMSATSELPLTHDVGDRISWTLRPLVSQKIDAAAKAKGKPTKSWEDRRSDMKKVCANCHTSNYIDNFYVQYDGAVNLYNDKFAIPVSRIAKKIREAGFLTNDIPFDDELEWIVFYLWHHEGRRARMGAAMFAPDYTQWHGFYEVADRFYMEFLPEVAKLVEHAKAEGGDKAKAAEEVEAIVAEVLEMDEHKWFTGNEPAEVKAARMKAAEEFKMRYVE
ncbi:MAG: multiheme c-type cytochrome [candidate division Zixibacteria bacterium]|nr:multiheme c-type cytochrome [candidate division Zixibacteria bacterium]MDH3938262.1 multiheme c-type cytochrome [candidate division Zixibacteria bacterium]MDH4032650.1 multiheme c-type cytochrome [candidate division Zixibacteria bacterium]